MENSPTASEKDREYMREAIRQMRQAGVLTKTGGPFGAVIVLDGTIVGSGGNTVIRDNDPTAHAEMNAIRDACRQLRRVNLSGAILYTSCECCPMCYAAAYWARISKIYYAAGWEAYNDLFDDANISHDCCLPHEKKSLAPQQILEDEALNVWKEFRQLPNGARY